MKLQATGQYDGTFGDGAGTPGDDGNLQMGVPLTYPRWIDRTATAPSPTRSLG